MRETDQLDVCTRRQTEHIVHQLHQLCLNLMSIYIQTTNMAVVRLLVFFCILPRGLGMVCNVDFAHSCGAGAAVASLNI